MSAVVRTSLMLALLLASSCSFYLSEPRVPKTDLRATLGGAYEVPPGYPAQDYDRLLALAQEQRVGTIGIRVLAGGALSGQVARHPTAIPTVAPIASGPDYATDATRARALEPLVAQGHAGSVVEAALRFAITGPALSTVLIGCSDLAQLDYAAAAVNRGPLPPTALATLRAIWTNWGQVLHSDIS